MNWNPNQKDPYAPPHGAFQPPAGQAPFGQNPYAQNPYGQQPPPKSGGSWLWLWILLGVGGVGFLSCCGCCGVFAWIGMSQEEREIQAKLEGNPVIVEHIGEITSLSRNWSKSVNDDNPNTWYFRLVGSKGEGDLIIQEVAGLHLDKEEIQIEWARLVLDDGQEFDVLP